MPLAGLSLAEMLALLGGIGGALVLLYLLELRRRRVEIPYSPLWARVASERQSSSLFRALKRLLSLLLQQQVIPWTLLKPSILKKYYGHRDLLTVLEQVLPLS